MVEREYTYVIVGAGLAGVSAAEGIRELDTERSLIIIGTEDHLPYDRPPLTKKLWFGKKIESVYLHNRSYYDEHGMTLALASTVVSVDPKSRTINDDRGTRYHYQKLLLATGGVPRTLQIRGGALPGISYFRRLDDYIRLRADATVGRSALVIGSGFIGSEIAAALSKNQLGVTMLYPEDTICSRVFPEGLSRAMQEQYQKRGVEIVSGDRPAQIEKKAGRFVITTEKGREIHSDLVVAGIGINPVTGLAAEAGLLVEDGVVVDDYLQTSDPDIFAAGDSARFPYRALGTETRIEHWDHAAQQGRKAGRNMAGAREGYDHLPYFFSDLFEFGYEAVGEVDAQLQTFADWQTENEKGAIYYMNDGQVRGVMLCNIWEKLSKAREMILSGTRFSQDDLRGAIR